MCSTSYTQNMLSHRPRVSPFPQHYPKVIGFTLIELLVVIVIVSILIVLVAPALTTAREAINGSKCTQNIHSLLIANCLFAADNDGMLVPHRGYPPNSVNTNTVIYWQGLLDGYMGGTGLSGSKVNAKQVCCPSMTDTNKCFSAWGFPISIGINSRGSGGFQDQPGFVKATMLKFPKIAYFGDSIGPNSHALGYGGDYNASSRNQRPSVFRHRGRANIGFLDGHVESLTQTDIPPVGTSGAWFYGN